MKIMSFLMMASLHAAAPAADAVARTEANRGAVTRAFALWAAEGGNVFDLLADDVVWTVAGNDPSVARTYRGKDAFMRGAVHPLASRMRVPLRPTVHRIWADGDEVIVRWDGRGVANDGVPYSNSYLWIFTMRDGKASHVTAFLDNAAFAEVLRRAPVARSR